MAPSTEYFDPGYSQVIPHQRESVGSDHNSAERVQNDPPENQSGKESPTATEPTTSGEDMASYMLSMTSGSVSEITQIHQELHLENPHYHKGKKNPPVPTQVRDYDTTWRLALKPDPIVITRSTVITAQMAEWYRASVS